MEDDQATDNPAPHELVARWREVEGPLAEAEKWFEDAGLMTRLKVRLGLPVDAPRDPFSMGVCQGFLDAADELEASLKAWDDSWKAQCHAQAEQIVKLRDLILELEWQPLFGVKMCFVCAGSPPDHSPNCKLAKTMEPYR